MDLRKMDAIVKWMFHQFFVLYPDLCEGWKTRKKDDPEQKKNMRLTAEKNVMSSVIHFDGRGFVAIIVGFL